MSYYYTCLTQRHIQHTQSVAITIQEIHMIKWITSLVRNTKISLNTLMNIAKLLNLRISGC